MGGYISYLFEERHPTEVTDVQQTEDSSPVSSSSPNPEEEKSDLPYVPQCTISDTPLDTTTTESIFQTASSTDHTEDVDKIYIFVIYAGKSIEIFIFPLEKISYLLQQACDQLQKKAENMSLIFDGEKLDVTKTVSHYPSLRRGTKVNLIRAS
ncbi:hypothetical protein KOW79_006654 [Hemibagrus wyckioides]|uniref:Rad60/SUMO-like domain-containing protein n=1 Tax=Hemibagrus wyckioides TaxID=337641 RepID=A0A9D3NXS4_9TELE|nr:hypothetical protein KOW79_006654 [Hemibagrus wyckioides]